MKKLITEREILALLQSGNTEFIVEKDMLITPLAADRIKIAGIRLIKPSDQQKKNDENRVKRCFQTLAFGSDHTGFLVKNEIKVLLEKEGVIVTDIGCYNDQSCDYPDFAIKAAQKVQNKEVDGAILFDATGIPSAITANKLKGIRAATAYNEFCAKSCRGHNNANILVVGAKTLGIETIKGIVDVWLHTVFEGGRHQNRLDKIAKLEH